MQAAPLLIVSLCLVSAACGARIKGTVTAAAAVLLHAHNQAYFLPYRLQHIHAVNVLHCSSVLLWRQMSCAL